MNKWIFEVHIKKLSFILCFGSIFLFFYINGSTYPKAQSNYLFPDNRAKQFVTAGEFNQTDQGTKFTAFEDADINLEQKLLYKDLKDFINSNVNEYFYMSLSSIYSNLNESVSPHRQVYFYCSILDKEKTLLYKYKIFDAETEKTIAEGLGEKFK